MGDVERVSLVAPDALAARVDVLRGLFPEAFAEGVFDAGRLAEAVAPVLPGGDASDAGARVFPGERYELNWAGKRAAIAAIKGESAGTLLPDVEASVNFDAATHSVIEGDNLEVLKLLQTCYHGRVKMIYIDPPYNTGNEFIYPDNYTEGLGEYLRFSGQVLAGGAAVSTNRETSGRFHSKWLSMMYPRLFVAKTLLKDDGVIFVSIDDNEVHNLREVMNEIYGSENFVSEFIWKRRTGANDSKAFYSSSDHEYVLAYARSPQFVFQGIEKVTTNYTNPDKDSRGAWTKSDLTCNKTREDRPNLFYPITDPKTGITYEANPNRVWAYEPERMKRIISENKVIFPRTGVGTPMYKRHLAELRSNRKPLSSWVVPTSDDASDADDESLALRFPLNTTGTKQFIELMGGSYFSFPKSPDMIAELVRQATSADGGDIILDFFAGSGTTAQAVMELNAEDGGNRRAVLVQLPEPVDKKSAAFKAGYRTIADITRDRVRKVIARSYPPIPPTPFPLSEGKKGGVLAGLLLGLDLAAGDVSPVAFQRKATVGFRAFRLAESNFRVWDGLAGDAADLEARLALYAANLKPDASDAGLLWEVVLKHRGDGVDLNAPVRSVDLGGGVSAWAVGDGEPIPLLVCLARELTRSAADAMAGLSVRRVVCLDAAFSGDDALLTNFALCLQDKNIAFATI